MYGFTTTLVDNAFDRALARTVEVVKVEGFSVLSAGLSCRQSACRCHMT